MKYKIKELLEDHLIILIKQGNNLFCASLVEQIWHSKGFFDNNSTNTAKQSEALNTFFSLHIEIVGNKTLKSLYFKD